MVLVLGREEPHNVFPMLITNCASGIVNVQKYSLMCIMNLVLHDENKRRILDKKGVEIIVYTSGSDDGEVRELGANVLKALADLKATNELQDKKASFGVEGMVQFLVRGENMVTKKLAIEALAEQLWLEPSKQDEIASCGGLEVIVALCEGPGREGAVTCPLGHSECDPRSPGQQGENRTAAGHRSASGRVPGPHGQPEGTRSRVRLVCTHQRLRRSRAELPEHVTAGPRCAYRLCRGRGI
jgi:hypothetical protein